MESIYINPLERDYASYNEHLIAFNRSFQGKIASDLEKLFEKEKIEDFSITTTGSDGRLEKGPISPIEVLILKEDNNFQDIVSGLKKFICTFNGKNVFNKYLEVKDINKDPMYKCSVQDQQIGSIEFVSPNRIFDMRLLYGDGSLITKALDKFTQELKSPKGKNLLKMLKTRVREHSQISLSGHQEFKGDNLNHYEFNEGVAFYNPDKGLWSFKQGPLRTVQYALIRDLVKKIRSEFSPKTIFSLPKNVVEKLNRLEAEDLIGLSSSQSYDLTDSYKYFSHLYHKSQFAYAKNKTKELTFDQKEVAERCSSIFKLCSQNLIR